MNAVVDRITENMATILFEDQGAQIHVPIDQLPENTREGSWLTVNFNLDPGRTEEMAERNRRLLERLRSKRRDSR